jgi:hypothetical protein
MDGAAIPQYGQVKLPNSTTVYKFCDQIWLSEVSFLSKSHRGKSGACDPTAGLLSKFIQGVNFSGVNES